MGGKFAAESALPGLSKEQKSSAQDTGVRASIPRAIANPVHFLITAVSCILPTNNIALWIKKFLFQPGLGALLPPAHELEGAWESVESYIERIDSCLDPQKGQTASLWRKSYSWLRERLPAVPLAPGRRAMPVGIP